MGASVPERVAVLVIRAWTEGGPASLRARITRTDDVAAKNDVVSVVTSAAEVRSEVDAWLHAILGTSDGQARGNATEE